MIGLSDPPRIQRYNRGLEGLIAGSTSISDIDGRAGRLYYRGYSIEDLARHLDYEKVAYLILFGEIPEEEQAKKWHQELIQWREAPPEAFAALERLPAGAHPLAIYRTMLTVAACYIPEPENTHLDAQWRRPARLMSWAATLAAAAVRHMKGQKPVPPRGDLSFSRHLLYQILGREPDELESSAFDTSLTVQAEHGLHAAAFAALVVISTGADLGSAVLAGMGALSGVRHGGANQLAFEELNRLGGPEQAKAWATEMLDKKYRFSGFGHRVYKAEDPRVRVLSPYAEAILKEAKMGDLWQTHVALRDTVEERLGPQGIYANVDAVTGLVYHPLGLPTGAFPLMFCLAIQTGWMAHCLEYLPNGSMVEPGSIYLGEA